MKPPKKTRRAKCEHPEILIFTEWKDGEIKKESAWCPTCHKNLKLKRQK